MVLLGQHIDTCHRQYQQPRVGECNYTATKAGKIDTLDRYASYSGTIGTQTVSISAVDLSFVSPASNTTVNIDAAQSVTRFLNNGVGVAGQTVTFSTTRGTVIRDAVTNAAGDVTVSISSSTAGAATVLAQLSGGGQATLPKPFLWPVC